MQSEIKAPPRQGTLFSPIATGVLGIAILILYWPVLVNLFSFLATDEDFSYGLLLPLVSGYIVYLKLPQLRLQPWRPSWWGVPVMVIGFSLYVVGRVAADLYSPPFSCVVVLGGFLLLMGGWGILRLLGFPLLLLLLMIPLPSVVTSSLTGPLQLLSSNMAAGLLRAVGIPLVRQGNVIDLGVRQLQVVAACSGLRYILALTALGIIFCYFYQRQVWKAAILIIVLIPAAIIANALRVAAMGIFPALQEGFWHGFSGWLIFLFCFGTMAIINWLLNYQWPSTPAPAAPISATVAEDLPAASRVSFVPYLSIALLLIIISGATVWGLGETPPVPLRQSFDNFPLHLGSWQGKRTYMDPEIFAQTAANAYFDAEYSQPDHAPVSLYIAYFEKQSKPGALGHNPNTCMTGTGWNTIQAGILKLPDGLSVNFLITEREGVRLLVYYWNLQQGKWFVAANLWGMTNKLHIIYHWVTSRRTDWALVRLITPVGNDVEAAKKRLSSFIKPLVPVLPQFMQN